jgi:hypothetical protein
LMASFEPLEHAATNVAIRTGASCSTFMGAACRFFGVVNRSTQDDAELEVFPSSRASSFARTGPASVACTSSLPQPAVLLRFPTG